MNFVHVTTIIFPPFMFGMGCEKGQRALKKFNTLIGIRGERAKSCREAASKVGGKLEEHSFQESNQEEGSRTLCSMM